MRRELAVSEGRNQGSVIGIGEQVIAARALSLETPALNTFSRCDRAALGFYASSRPGRCRLDNDSRRMKAKIETARNNEAGTGGTQDTRERVCDMFSASSFSNQLAKTTD